MSNPWKTSWNVLVSFALFASSLGLVIGDFRYSGEILFSNSGGLAWLAFFSFLWFVLAHIFAIFPKRVIFPVLFLVSARMATGFPLNLWMTNNAACQITSVALVIITGIYFFGSIKHFLGLNQRPWFDFKHSLSILMTGVAVLVASIPFGIGGMVASAQNVVGNYIRVSPGSISLLERVFTRNGKSVHLVGMMHIGEEDFYLKLNQKMGEKTAGKRIVLTEGVSDKNKILPEDFKSGQTYGKWATKLGLKVQNSSERQMTEAEIEQRNREFASCGVAFLNADIDISELSEQHQQTLTKILIPLGSDNLAEIFKATDIISGSEMEDLMMEGLIKFRNDRLMEYFNESIQLDVAEIYIPWGAAHLPDIEARLIKQGFEKISEETRPVVRFWKR